MTRDLFFEILENNPKLNEYDLQQIIAVLEDAVDENILNEYYLKDINKLIYLQIKNKDIRGKYGILF